MIQGSNSHEQRLVRHGPLVLNRLRFPGDQYVKATTLQTPCSVGEPHLKLPAWANYPWPTLGRSIDYVSSTISISMFLR
ncbi:hypothetical protein NXS19_001831 [Fusarium pseudograminearum]|nr:hypothetical protein NXS19_001831 [Fusarium pseudograminearum]